MDTSTGMSIWDFFASGSETYCVSELLAMMEEMFYALHQQNIAPTPIVESSLTYLLTY